MQLNLNYMNSSPNGSGSFTGIYKFSFFATKHIEYGAAYVLTAASALTSTDIAPFVNFNILSGSGKFVFYLGATCDISQYTYKDVTGSVSKSYFGYGGNAGIRVYMTENVFFTAEQKIYALGDPNNTTNYLTTAGIGVLMKKKK